MAPTLAAKSAPTRASFAFMRRHPARWLALGFGSGLSPRAPGTVGTLWAWLTFLVLSQWLGATGWAAAELLLAMRMGLAAGGAARRTDPPGS